MRTLILVISFLLQTLSVFAQREAANWFFGQNAGLDFSSGAPVAISGGALSTSEGCTSISDRNGNLLFYSDGITVWNRNHLPMPNGSGLMGHTSSTTSALVVRQPGSDNLFYIFTADGNSNATNHHSEHGYRYSVVDMNLDGGLGDITAAKNIMLYAPCTEKLAAVKAADGVGMWLMTHEVNSAKFRAYKIDCNGINTNAVISECGVTHVGLTSNGYMDVIGQMKFSPDGKRLGVAILGQLKVQLFDFDNATGVVSNPLNVMAYWMDGFLQPNGQAFDFENIYGLEFSPNGKVLYLTCIDNGNLFQYDLSSNDSWTISSSGNLFQMGPWCTPDNFGWSCPGVTGGLQLGTDGRIYGAYKYHNGLNVIAHPDVYGSGCAYTTSPLFSGESKYGLPGFAASYFDPAPFAMEQLCMEVKVSSLYPAISQTWTFSRTDGVVLQTVHGVSASYEFSVPGNYIVSLALTNASGCTDTLRRIVTVKECSLTVPNIFSPNGDGINDVFLLEGIDKYPDNELYIFDRWGKRIFYGKQYPTNGYFSGENVSDGVYFYTLSLGADTQPRKGFFTIVR